MTEIVRAYIVTVSNSDLPDVMLVGVVGERKETQLALRRALTELMNGKRLFYNRINIYSIDESKEESPVKFFNRMHKENKFMRIVIYEDDSFEICYPEADSAGRIMLETSYDQIPVLGGAEHIVCDGVVTWNIGETGLAFADDSIFDFENRHRNYDCAFEWMDLEEFMDIQYRIYEDGILRHNEMLKREKSKWDSWVLLRPSEYWVKTVTQSKVDGLIQKMREGVVFRALVVELDKEGKLLDFQEGRHRSVALKQLGIKKLPVWVCKKRF